MDSQFRWRKLFRLVAGASLLAFSTLTSQQKTLSNVLPVPSGPSAIGRVTYFWIDSSRPAFLEKKSDRPRELMVDVWYPARGYRTTPTAPYLPELAVITHSAPDAALGRRFAPAWELVKAGRLTTHAVEGASAQCQSRGCPVLVFSHGGGVDRSFYTAQYEDLSSHGYVVAVIAHTYDTHAVTFPDGRVVRAAQPPRDTVAVDSSLPRWRRDLAREARSEAYVRTVLDVEAADIRFVIDQLSRYATDRKLKAAFVGQLDLSRVGALGHSAGGEAAARACQLDLRIRACLNQDGVMHNLPFARDAKGRTMQQPFMYVGREARRPTLSDTVLASMEISRVEVDSLIAAIARGQDDLLADMPGGAYRLTLKVAGATHMSFSDEPLMTAAGDSMKRSSAVVALRLVQTYTRSFFDKTLAGRSSAPLHIAQTDSALVTLERFTPKRP